MGPPRVLVVGGGVAGLTAAALLQKCARVTIIRPNNLRCDDRFSTGLWNQAQLISGMNGLSTCAVTQSAYLAENGVSLATPPQLSASPSSGRPSLAFVQSSRLIEYLEAKLTQCEVIDGTVAESEHDDEFDSVIVADGRCRQTLEPCGYTVYRGVASAESVHDVDCAFQTWGHNGCRFAVVPVAEKKWQWYATIPCSSSGDRLHLGPRPPLATSWTRPAASLEIAAHFADFHDPIMKLIKASEAMDACEAHASYSVPNSPLDPKRILIGDSFHVLDPILAIGASVAIEEAALLAQAFKTGLPLSQFHRQRVERRKQLMLISRAANFVGQLPAPVSRLRNLAMQWTPGFVSTALIEMQIKKLAQI